MDSSNISVAAASSFAAKHGGKIWADCLPGIDARGELARHVRVVLLIVHVAHELERVEQCLNKANVGHGDLICSPTIFVQCRIDSTWPKSTLAFS
jgi:hypothetical protein